MFTQLMVGMALTVMAPAPKDAKKDVDSIVGSWEPEKIVVNGMEPPLPPGAAIRFRFNEDGTMTLIKGLAGGQSDGTKGSYSIDNKKAPASLDMTPDMDKGQAVRAIYKIEGGKLLICASEGKDERPTEFAAPVGSGLILFTLKRVTEK